MVSRDGRNWNIADLSSDVVRKVVMNRRYYTEGIMDQSSCSLYFGDGT